MSKQTLQKQECDRCGDDFERKQLRRQDGLLVCRDCYDAPIKVKPRTPVFGSPRDNSTTTTAATNRPIVFSISSAGITYISHSFSPTREGVRRYFEMHLVSTGGVVAVPTIVLGQEKDLLTLKGTSDTDYLTFSTTGTVALSGPTYNLTDGKVISFVCGTSTWTETSRGGF